MNRWSTPFLAIGLILTMINAPAFSQTLQLTPVATHHTGLFDLGGAESVAFDAATKRLFFINAQANQLSILDLNKPESPALVDSIRLNAFGDRPTQVIASNGRLAVSIVAFPPTDPGKVVLFDATGKLLAQYPVGAAPSALAFTPDGKKLLVANEGEPSDDYSTDPEGSVSIITLESGMVQTAAFSNFNAQAAALRSRGVRLLGSNATVAQDLEP
ncbi:MAG: choice-of-anchor I domain-containing protein, partial [Haliscomenobacter sp.]